MQMHVAFYKVDGGRLCAWLATPPRRETFQGTTMASGKDLPHDLAQFVVEATLGVEHGFWGLLANGATFRSVPGRRRTKPGQQFVRAHVDELDAVEGIVIEHVEAWRRGAATPVDSALDAMYTRWKALGVREELRVDRASVAKRLHNKAFQRTHRATFSSNSREIA